MSEHLPVGIHQQYWLWLLFLMFSSCSWDISGKNTSTKESVIKKPTLNKSTNLASENCYTPSDQDKKNWLSTKGGRTKYLWGTTDPENLNQFVPSGRKAVEKTLGQWKILLRPPIFYSNQEDPDTSKDRPASAIVYYKEQAHFAGKGYKFSIMENPKTEKAPLFILRYWTGVMGCSFIDLSFFQDPESTGPLLEYRSTRSAYGDHPGDLCQPRCWSHFFL